MSQIQVVGVDLAKQVFQVHAIAADGSIVLKRQFAPIANPGVLREA